MKAIYSILFIIILAAPHMAFAAPASSDDPICERAEPKIIDLTPICKRGFDRYYACQDGTYLDFYPDPPICRFKHGDGIAGDAFLKSTPGPDIRDKNESKNESKTNPTDIINKPMPFNIGNDAMEWAKSNPELTTVLVVFVPAIIIIFIIIGKRRKKSKNVVRPENYGKADDFHTHDSKIPTQETKSTMTDPIQKDSSAIQNPDIAQTIPNTLQDQDITKKSLSNQQIPPQEKPQSSQKIIQNKKYIIIPDTNICLMHNKENDENNIQFFTRDTRFLVLDVVKREAKRVIKRKNLSYIPTNDKHENPTQNILNVTHKLQDLIKKDFDKHLDMVKNMYKEINSDESFEQQRIRWHYIKKQNPNPEPPYKVDDSRYDQNILAKASWLASVNENVTVVLLTNDSDFVIFPHKIRETLNVHVLYGYKYWEEITEYSKDPIDDIINMNQVDLLEFYDIIGPDGMAKKKSTIQYSE